MQTTFWKLGKGLLALIALALIIIVALGARMLFPQAPAPAFPIPLTEMERTKEENIMLRLQILQRDQQDFISQAYSAHHLDPARYHFDNNQMAFVPNYVPPAEPAKPVAPAATPKK